MPSFCRILDAFSPGGAKSGSGGRETEIWGSPFKLITRLILTAAFLCLFLTPAMAQVLAADVATTPSMSPDRPQRVGFVDMDVVLQDSRAVWEVLREVDEEMERRERDITAKRRELRRLELRLEQQGGVLSEAERRRREQEIIALVEEIDEAEYRFSRDVREKEQTLIGPLRRMVLELVRDVARRENFDIVLNGEMVLYGTDPVDLTVPVLQLLDSKGDELRRALNPPRRSGMPALPGPDSNGDTLP